MLALYLCCRRRPGPKEEPKPVPGYGTIREYNHTDGKEVDNNWFNMKHLMKYVYTTHEGDDPSHKHAAGVRQYPDEDIKGKDNELFDLNHLIKYR